MQFQSDNLPFHISAKNTPSNFKRELKAKQIANDVSCFLNLHILKLYSIMYEVCTAISYG